jgi:outer membrane protein assembly factor BamD (BamD/ComL family)
LKIGAAREKQKNYPDAVKAYEIAADRYYNQPAIASDALYRQGIAHQKQAATAEYDQGTAALAIAAYTDFKTLFPNDPRVPEAEKAIVALKTQQVEGSFRIAKFYEQNKVLNAEQRRDGALVYYNQVLQLDPNSPFAAQARQREEQLRPRAATPPAN